MRPGPLSIDEVIYQWMARSVAEGHGLTIANGWEARPSPELATTAYMYAGEGGLTAQYPYYFPWLAAPFHAAMGFLGLFLVNALAFVGVVAVTYRIGRRLLVDPAVALLGTGILVLGTFAWEYSVAAWPHMATLLAQVGAFALVLEALSGAAPPTLPPSPFPDGDAGRATDPARRRRMAAAAGAGFVLAVGVGFRRDAVFFLPVLALPLLYHRPVRGWELAALFAGAVPPLVGLSATNWSRWGILSPLSYGRAQAWTLPVAAVGAAGVLVLALLALRPVQEAVLRRWKAVVLGGLAVALAALLLPPTRRLALGAADGVEALLFDLRGAGTEVGNGPPIQDWAVIYLGVLKKSLLQSLPWLPLAALPLVAAVRRPELRWKAALLLLPALAYIPPQAIFERHGGMSANLRYFLPTLPFLALLAAAGVDVVRGAAGGAWRPVGTVAGGGVLAAAAGWLLVRPGGFEEPLDAELAALDAPLVLAVLTAAAVAWWGARWWRGAAAKGDAGVARPAGGRAMAAPSFALFALAGAAVAWAGLLGFDYDARWSREVRTSNLVRAHELAEMVEPGSLVLSTYLDYHGTLPELVDDVIVAFPHGDGFRDMRPLLLHHLDAGRPVYAAMAGYEWRWVQEHGLLEGLQMRVVNPGPIRVLQMRRAGGR